MQQEHINYTCIFTLHFNEIQPPYTLKVNFTSRKNKWISEILFKEFGHFNQCRVKEWPCQLPRKN